VDVAISELKEELTAFVQRAAAGEHITVTDEGRPVAVLGPPIGRIDLAPAAESGWLVQATGVGLQPVRRYQPVRSVREILDEDRGG
jgi:prevent-host-death family protein